MSENEENKENKTDVLEDESIEGTLQDSKEEIILQTHTHINKYLCGEIVEHTEMRVVVNLTTHEDMVVDNYGLIHGGFIFGAADFAAMSVVNEKNVVLVASNSEFLSPVKLGDIVSFTAILRQTEGRKRNIDVKAFVHDIKVFEGEFKTVITDRHVLKLKLLDEDT